MDIREIREKVGLTQQELAEKIGVAPRTISRYETGERTPDEEKIKLIAFHLGVEVEEMKREEEKQEDDKMPEKKNEFQGEKKQENIEETRKRIMCPFRTFTRRHEDGYSVQKFSECLYESCAMYRVGECKMNA